MGLFNSTVLEVVIGVIFVYLLLSILCTSANEWVAALTRRRGEMLRKGIRQLLENQPVRGDSDAEGFLREFYKHPLIASLKHDKNHPAYIAPRTFVAVVTDLLTAAKPGSVEFADFENGAKELPDGNVKKSILALVQRSNQKFEAVQLAVEGWFNDAMDRVNEDHAPLYITRQRGKGAVLLSADDYASIEEMLYLMSSARNAARLTEASNPVPQPNLELQDLDQVTVFARTEFRTRRTVGVHGAVRRPGVVTYADSMTLRDAVLMAGGITEAASLLEAEVSRLQHPGEERAAVKAAMVRVYLSGLPKPVLEREAAEFAAAAAEFAELLREHKSALGELVTWMLLGRVMPFHKVTGFRFDAFGGVTVVPTYAPQDALRGSPAALHGIARDLKTARAVLDGQPRAELPDLLPLPLQLLPDLLDPGVRAALPAYEGDLAEFLYWTGWRTSEAKGLRWSNVDEAAGIIRIEDTKNREPRTLPYSALPALAELMREHGAAFLGSAVAPGMFPLLTKFIFTTERLSIQVHPDDERAHQWEGGPGKTEMWYVLRAEPGAAIALGFKHPITRERLREAALSGEIEELVQWFPVKAGDTFFTPTGTVHAIGAGVALCEIQQNSDLTYRLYDYGRPRELHLDKGIAVANLGPHPGQSRPVELSEGRWLLAGCRYFVTELVEQAGPQEYRPDPSSVHVPMLLEGAGTIAGRPFGPGEVWVVPARAAPFEVSGHGRFLRSYVPKP